MPAGLHRTYGAHHLHFITNSCYRRLPLLASAGARDRFLSILEQTRRKYQFVVVGYVVMPEHIHLLLTEPELGSPSTVMQVLKQRTARALLAKRKRRDPRQGDLFVEATRRAFWLSKTPNKKRSYRKKRPENRRHKKAPLSRAGLRFKLIAKS
ncbi:MAG TPA: transposase [Candidatus Sulfotelmatobacter sp.]|nr:transposase [Candidatus Sulfotelmatobacter sp.]